MALSLVDVLPGLKAGASTPPDGSAVAPQGPPPFLPALKDGVSRRISMSTTIGSVHGNGRHAGSRLETTAWLSTVGLMVTLALGIFVAPLAAEAQPPAKV